MWQDLRAAHSPVSESASPSWPPLGPHPPPVVGRALVGTYVDVQLYVLVGDERQCGQSEFHGPKSPKGHQAWMRRGGRKNEGSPHEPRPYFYLLSTC